MDSGVEEVILGWDLTLVMEALTKGSVQGRVGFYCFYSVCSDQKQRRAEDLGHEQKLESCSGRGRRRIGVSNYQMHLT